MKYLRADLRFALPDDFEGSAIDALLLARGHLTGEDVPALKHTACYPRPHADERGHSSFYHNMKLGHQFTGFLGAYTLNEHWVELPSGVIAHGSCEKGWIK